MQKNLGWPDGACDQPLRSSTLMSHPGFCALSAIRQIAEMAPALLLPPGASGSATPISLRLLRRNVTYPGVLAWRPRTVQARLH